MKSRPRGRQEPTQAPQDEPRIVDVLEYESCLDDIKPVRAFEGFEEALQQFQTRRQRLEGFLERRDEPRRAVDDHVSLQGAAGQMPQDDPRHFGVSDAEAQHAALLPIPHIAPYPFAIGYGDDAVLLKVRGIALVRLDLCVQPIGDTVHRAVLIE